MKGLLIGLAAIIAVALFTGMLMAAEGADALLAKIKAAPDAEIVHVSAWSVDQASGIELYDRDIVYQSKSMGRAVYAVAGYREARDARGDLLKLVAQGYVKTVPTSGGIKIFSTAEETNVITAPRAPTVSPWSAEEAVQW